MRKEKQGKLAQVCVNFSGWDYAINVAEGQIKEAEEKVKRLRISIQTFEEMKAKGEPFPSEGSEETGVQS